MKSKKPITDCIFACADDSTCVHPKATTPECHIDACPRLAPFVSDLLDACEAWMNWIKGGNLSHEDIIAQTNAAIAKAKGEQ